MHFFAWEKGFVGKNRSTLRHWSAIDRGEAREGDMEGYSGKSILLIKRDTIVSCFCQQIKDALDWIGLVLLGLI